MPLHKLIQVECDSCGHCDYSESPLAWAKKDFTEKGYLQVNGRWYCDTKCKDNHKVKLKQQKNEASIN
jgi:hypothetical protein